MTVEATLAAGAVALLVPYFEKAAGKAAETVGQAAANAGGQLLAALRRRLVRPAERQALRDLEAAPAEADNQADLRKRLREVLADDPTFRDEIKALIDALPTETKAQIATVTGDGNIVGQVQGSGTVTIGGR